VIATAGEIADAEGLEAATLARVAARLDVRAPSLYRHVAGVEGLRHGVTVQALATLGEALRGAAVGRSGAAAVRAAADAYRAYALAHPGRYAATQVLLPKHQDDELREAAAGVVDVVAGMLRAWALEGDEAIHAVRAFRATVHGFVSLELCGGFGLDLDRDVSFARLIELLVAGLGSEVDDGQ
jgi:AcrR family transcriptional regulator